ncbi:MAG TPA: hypothetical protein VF631_07930 [Allosphingosinicella sp.]|jgi:hypothetical protein|uniref:hypothetical protein n=1 Tax=Allosphingosinicella sp. TaxID=2823234 RepID=UPI002F28006E
MPSQPKRLQLALIASAVFLVAAAPAERLSYDLGVFLAGECLSPSLTGCGTADGVAIAKRSASEALLDAGREPRLELDIAVLSDIGPEVSGGGGPESPLAR